MKEFLTPEEQRYKNVISSIGITMLVFFFLINTVGILLMVLQILLDLFGVPTVASEVVYQICYAVGYLLSFMLPVLVLRFRIRKCGYQYDSMKSEMHLSPALFPIIMGGMILIWAQSYINASIVNIFNYSAFSSDVIWGNSAHMKGYQIVLEFIVMCLVPAFCEEFLFRGAILTNCLPFGRGNAILISSLLFGLMHQNAEQILYAFAAGILLGVVYERTGSIWNCTFLHLINNFSSTAINVVSEHFGGRYSEIVQTVAEGVLVLIGIACIPALVIALTPKKTDFRNGVFGKSVPAADDYASCAIPAKRAFRLFLNLPMVFFLVLCVLQVLILLLMAVFYGSAAA